MNEAVNYINHLQKNIKGLNDKRDQLKNKLSMNSSLENHENASSGFIIHQNSGTLIEISGFSEEGVPLSKLLQLLLEEGLQVIGCLSSQVNGRLLHTVQCEVCTYFRDSCHYYVIILKRKKKLHTNILYFPLNY